jgi:hypothetical protein
MPEAIHIISASVEAKQQLQVDDNPTHRRLSPSSEGYGYDII